MINYVVVAMSNISFQCLITGALAVTAGRTKRRCVVSSDLFEPVSRYFSVFISVLFLFTIFSLVSKLKKTNSFSVPVLVIVFKVLNCVLVCFVSVPVHVSKVFGIHLRKHWTVDHKCSVPLALIYRFEIFPLVINIEPKIILRRA